MGAFQAPEKPCILRQGRIIDGHDKREDEGQHLEKKADFIVDILDDKWKMKEDMKRKKMWERFQSL